MPLLIPHTTYPLLVALGALYVVNPRALRVKTLCESFTCGAVIVVPSLLTLTLALTVFVPELVVFKVILVP